VEKESQTFVSTNSACVSAYVSASSGRLTSLRGMQRLWMPVSVMRRSNLQAKRRRERSPSSRDKSATGAVRDGIVYTFCGLLCCTKEEGRKKWKKSSVLHSLCPLTNCQDRFEDTKSTITPRDSLTVVPYSQSWASGIVRSPFLCCASQNMLVTAVKNILFY
jgi:hypothetical protein